MIWTVLRLIPCLWRHDYEIDWLFNPNMQMKQYGLHCKRCGHWNL